MGEKKLKALAAEWAKGLKSEADLNQFSRMLTKITVETVLNAELTDHLGHEKNVGHVAGRKRRYKVLVGGVLTELKNRGLQDIMIARVDGLKGFLDAINSVYPLTHIQFCIIHMVRNSLKYVSWKVYKAVISGLKTVYRALTEEAALMAVDAFADIWDEKYPQISKSWRTHWENLNTLFSYPLDIRKAIYTMNAIESLNSVIRAAIKKRKVFLMDDSVRKVIYLAIKDASKKWVC